MSRKKMVDQLTDPAYYILLSLVEAKHGYSIMKEIGDMTEGEMLVGPATLYTHLKKLQETDLIRLYGEEEERRKTYIATEKGVKLLHQEVERRRKMVLHAERMLEKLGGEGK